MSLVVVVVVFFVVVEIVVERIVVKRDEIALSFPLSFVLSFCIFSRALGKPLSPTKTIMKRV